MPAQTKSVPDLESPDMRMLFYEKMCGRNKQLIPGVPAIIKLTGVSFPAVALKDPNHKFYTRIADQLVTTTKYLVVKTNAVLGYTYDSTIVLLLARRGVDCGADDYGRLRPDFMNGAISTINASLAPLAAAKFNTGAAGLVPQFAIAAGVSFNCRCFNVPDFSEAINYFCWREEVAERMSSLNLGLRYFSRNELRFKLATQIRERLQADKGVNWSDYPTHFRRGTYVFNRSGKPTVLDMPPIAGIKFDMEAAIFAGVDPRDVVDNRSGHLQS